MNILTFDIEEWYLEKVFWGDRPGKYREFDYYLDQILTILDARGFKGTFFCVGGMATEFPEVVKRIESRGHEIGCHSFLHTWLNKMSRDDVEVDTKKAIDALEQCIGKKVKSYRAPAFSIGKSNKWALEVLAQNGIMRDASVFPAVRDFGGFSEFGQNGPTMVFRNSAHIKEFPICTTKLLGRDVAYSGGGYFRFFPLNYVKNKMSESNYNMTYFHISDLVPESTGIIPKADYEIYFRELGTLKNRYMRYIKSNLGKKTAFARMMKLIETEAFLNLEQADQMIDWKQVSSIFL